ncbi:hypothetical protein SAMN04488012_11923 [Palleronia salina]|uniref:Transposase InsH N-terminal domain-containing protein n=1 Tax=Palleronia salina TaxID=313368 RepID=A0A1M6M2W4_9RHOB|nr:hypothetical protein SAMN04488012_11923 [Palleronia salina]
MLGRSRKRSRRCFGSAPWEDRFTQDHQLRSIDRFVDLRSIRGYLAGFYCHTGRSSVDPELLILMLLVG